MDSQQTRLEEIAAFLKQRFLGGFDNVVSAPLLVLFSGLVVGGLVFAWLTSWLLTVVVSALLAILVILWLLDHRKLKKRLEKKTEVWNRDKVELDTQISELQFAVERMDDLAIAMLNLIKPVSTLPVPVRVKPCLDDNIGGVVDLFLERAVHILGDKDSRASLLIPVRHKNKRYLEIWRHRNMPPESIQPKRFQLDDRHNEGVAGYAFSRGETLRAVLFNNRGYWECSHPSYKPRLPKNVEPEYKSFVVIPLKTDNRCLGVLCFDSKDPTMFDGQAVTDTLQDLADALAATLTIYNKLQALSATVSRNLPPIV